MKWRKKKDEGRFLHARNGDWLGSPFQCDYCWFINIEKREPRKDGYSDNRLLGYIRRVNLDIFWSREKGTVSGLLTQLRKGKRMSAYLNLDSIGLPLGPWSVDDNLGFQIALETVRASQEEGKNVKSYQQYDTIRKIRSAYSSVFETSPKVSHMGITFKAVNGKLTHFTDSPLNSVLFRHFMTGLERRMGRVVCQDLALDVRILVLILQAIAEEIRKPETTWGRKRHLAMCAGAFAALYAGALRGNEVLMMEGYEFCKRIESGKYDPRASHICVPLMGRFKQEDGERNLMFAFASVSNVSRIPIRKCLERVAWILRNEGKDQVVGPALCDEEGFVYPYWRLNEEFHSQLEKVREVRPDLIEEDVNIRERFNIYRSFRRGATTRAEEMKVGEAVIGMNNRWRKSQSNAGSLPKLPMLQLYTEIQQALLTRVRFSSCL